MDEAAKERKREQNRNAQRKHRKRLKSCLQELEQLQAQVKTGHGADGQQPQRSLQGSQQATPAVNSGSNFSNTPQISSPHAALGPSATDPTLATSASMLADGQGITAGDSLMADAFLTDHRNDHSIFAHGPSADLQQLPRPTGNFYESHDWDLTPMRSTFPGDFMPNPLSLQPSAEIEPATNSSSSASASGSVSATTRDQTPSSATSGSSTTQQQQKLVAAKPPAPPVCPGKKIMPILMAIQAAGYDSVDSFFLEYVVAKFPEDSVPHWAQKSSRCYKLPALIKEIVEQSEGWSEPGQQSLSESVLKMAGLILNENDDDDADAD